MAHGHGAWKWRIDMPRAWPLGLCGNKHGGSERPRIRNFAVLLFLVVGTAKTRRNSRGTGRL